MSRNSPLYILLFMTVLSVVFGTGISVVHYASADALQRNASLLKNRVLCRAFGLTVTGTSAADYERAVGERLKAQTITGEGAPLSVYRLQGADTLGIVFSGQGFWDKVTGILVLTGDKAHIAGLAFLEQHETPGLGARIEESWFLDQFEGLAVDWKAPSDRRIVIGGFPDPAAHNRADAVTGATQTSIAVMKSLNHALESVRKGL